MLLKILIITCQSSLQAFLNHEIKTTT